MANKNHILILCSRLDLPGGIERAVVNTANLFAEKNHPVKLVILDETIASFYPVHPAVQMILLPLSFGITIEGNVITRKIRLLSDVLKLRNLLKKAQPDFVIATEYPFAAAAILARAGKKSRVLSWEHHHLYELKKNFFWEKISSLTYPGLDAVVCLNKDEKKLFDKMNQNIAVIPNFTRAALSPSGLTNKTILTVARLAHVKGIDLLISAAKIVFRDHPGWEWKIIGGDGIDSTIKQVINDAGLSNQLFIQTPVDHQITAEYQNASLYVMTSRHECFPMTLLEAQANGLPCIAFDCETGPRHILINNETGLLVEKENVIKLAEAILFLIQNEEQRKIMGEKAFVNVQRFSPDKIYELWIKLFDEIKRPRTH